MSWNTVEIKLVNAKENASLTLPIAIAEIKAGFT